MDFKKRKKYRLADIATIERAKKNKTYKKGCICIQCSATKGQTDYLEEQRRVEGKYAVIELKIDINHKYFYLIFKEEIKGYLEKYQIGLNIRPELLEGMELELHTELETQEYIVRLMEAFEQRKDMEEEYVKKLKQFKQYHLDNMFPQNKKE